MPDLLHCGLLITCSTAHLLPPAQAHRDPHVREPRRLPKSRRLRRSSSRRLTASDTANSFAVKNTGQVRLIADRTPDPFGLSVFICGSSPPSGRCASPAKRARFARTVPTSWRMAHPASLFPSHLCSSVAPAMPWDAARHPLNREILTHCPHLMAHGSSRIPSSVHLWLPSPCIGYD